MTSPTVVTTTEVERIVVVSTVSKSLVTQAPVERLLLAAPGPVGPRGPEGPRSMYVSDAAPVAPPPTYAWIQTGLGADGKGFTLWFEDGKP